MIVELAVSIGELIVPVDDVASVTLQTVASRSPLPHTVSLVSVCHRLAWTEVIADGVLINTMESVM